MNDLLKLFLLFIIYSFIGYIIEVVIAIIKSKKSINRGFLVGPIIPVFGLGATGITVLLTRYYNDRLVIFIFGALLTTLIEYFVGYLLEKIFHNKWWDYGNHPGNINGRVWIVSSIMFGIGTLFIIYMANPILIKFLDKLSNITIAILSIVILILLISDIIYSVMIAYNLRSNIIIVEELKNKKLKDITKFLEAKLKKIKHQMKLNPDRLLRSFPKLREGNTKEFEIIAKIREKIKLERKTGEHNDKSS